jgi:undecaprenyl-diphosphatase
MKSFQTFVFLLLAWLGILGPSSIFAQNQDLRLVEKANAGRNQSLDPLYRQVSLSGYWVSLGYPISTIGIGFVKKDTVLWQRGLQQVAGSALTLALTIGLKESFQRPRPWTASSKIQPVSPLPGPNSFPSGHTSAAFATATHFALARPKWYFVVPAYSWASLVAWSRIRNGVHYPTDVLAGAVLGAGCAWLSHTTGKWLVKKRRKKFLQPF